MEAQVIEVAASAVADAAGAEALLVWLLPACIIFAIACIANVACGGLGQDDGDGGCGGD